MSSPLRKIKAPNRTAPASRACAMGAVLVGARGRRVLEDVVK
ncbi:hypothetical protein [Nonomuraea sp. NPDC049480]